METKRISLTTKQIADLVTIFVASHPPLNYKTTIQELLSKLLEVEDELSLTAKISEVK